MSISAKIKQYGLMNFTKRGFKFLLRKVLGIRFESFYFMINHINIEEINLRMLHYDYSDVRELTFDDFKLGDPDVFTPSKLQLIKLRFENDKYWAYGIVDNKNLIFSCWINAYELKYPTISNKAIPFTGNAASLQDAYCHPEYRGKGYHSKMTLYRLYKIAEMQIPKAITIVLFENIPSYKTQLKSGFIVEKHIKVFKFLNKTFQKEIECND